MLGRDGGPAYSAVVLVRRGVEPRPATMPSRPATGRRPFAPNEPDRDPGIVLVDDGGQLPVDIARETRSVHVRARDVAGALVLTAVLVGGVAFLVLGSMPVR